MRRAGFFAGILALAVTGVGLPAILAVMLAEITLPEVGHAQSVSVGVQTSNVQLGVQIGPTPPPLAVIPAPVVVAPGPPPPPVYYAPTLPYNYFVYQNVYYLYHDAHWFRGKHHNGPWTPIPIAYVPRRVLAVPADHYHNRPAHWEQHGPPPWAHERQREKEWKHTGYDDRGKEHGKGKGHGKDRD